MAKAAQRLWMCLYAHPPQPAELLETLACIAFRYSHQVHLLQSSVVLEIAGSVKLFSSIPQLISKITTSIRALEATVAIGIAPNPYGALLLAKVSKPGHVRYAKFFPQNLAEIAITQSQIPEPVCSALASAGM